MINLTITTAKAKKHGSIQKKRKIKQKQNTQMFQNSFGMRFIILSTVLERHGRPLDILVNIDAVHIAMRALVVSHE